MKYELGLSQEEAEKVDNLRFTWQKVLAQAVEVQNLLSRVQPYFRLVIYLMAYLFKYKT